MNNQSKNSSGTWLVTSMLLVGLIVAAAGWWFAYQQTHPVLDFYGPEVIAILRDPDDVTALRLVPGGPEAEIQYGQQRFDVAEEKNVFAGRGYTNARTALTKRGSYQWDPSDKTSCEPEWTHALRLENEHGTIVVLLSLDCPGVAIAGKDKWLPLQPKIAAGFAEILAAELDAAAEGIVTEGIGGGTAEE